MTAFQPSAGAKSPVTSEMFILNRMLKDPCMLVLFVQIIHRIKQVKCPQMVGHF